LQIDVVKKAGAQLDTAMQLSSALKKEKKNYHIEAANLGEF